VGYFACQIDFTGVEIASRNPPELPDGNKKGQNEADFVF
jgi:hypothetical protein